jgi:flagellar hook-associated protein 2
MAGVSLGGLASGLDTNTLVTQLMAIEQQPLTRLTASRMKAEGRKQVLDDLAVRLRALNTARADLVAPALLRDVQKLESSDSTRVGVRRAPGATGDLRPGTFTVDVTQVARTQRTTLTVRPPASGPQRIEVDVDGVTYRTANGQTSAQALADEVNRAQPPAPVRASVIDGQLVLDAKATGVAFTAAGPNLTVDPARSQSAQRALGTITRDGVTTAIDQTAATVVVDGVELDLRRATFPGQPVTVTVGAPGKDLDQIKAKVKAFVDAYNGAVDFARTKLREEKAAKPVTAADHARGALRGDVGLSAVMSGLRIAISTPVAGADPARDTLGELGISILAPVGAGAKSDGERLGGKLVLDEARLAEAVAAGSADVAGVLAGVGTRVNAILEPFARPGDGVLATRAQQADSEAGRLRTRFAEMERRLDKREDRLRAYFTRLETSLGAAQAQTAWLQGQIAGLGA